jgi:putative MFS transporter
MHAQARAVLRRFTGANRGLESDDQAHPGPTVIDEGHPVAGIRQLVRGRHASITWALLACGTGWGLVNFGFLLWLPTNLKELGVNPAATSALLARSAVFALPGIAVVITLYHRWSSFKALVLFITLTAATLLGFATLGALGVRSDTATTIATASLLISVSGVIAMLIPYAAEIYPVNLRGSGSGVIAASSKFGGIVGAALSLSTFFDHFALSAIVIAVPMTASALMLLRSGVETRGVGLEDIQETLGV